MSLGVYRLAPGAHTWHRVGGGGLDSRNIYHVQFDGAGHVYAATNAGLFRHSDRASGPWHVVLKPDPNPTHSPYRTSQITDVTFQKIQEIHAMGTAILLVEQNVSRALSLVQRAYVLESGKVIMHGTSAELAGNKQVQTAYLGI